MISVLILIAVLLCCEQKQRWTVARRHCPHRSGLQIRLARRRLRYRMVAATDSGEHAPRGLRQDDCGMRRFAGKLSAFKEYYGDNREVRTWSWCRERPE
jgi:hypothetical protein